MTLTRHMEYAIPACGQREFPGRFNVVLIVRHSRMRLAGIHYPAFTHLITSPASVPRFFFVTVHTATPGNALSAATHG